MKTFNLKEETINNVLNYLATQPFNKVNQLIGAIQQECKPQINANEEEKKNDTTN